MLWNRLLKSTTGRNLTFVGGSSNSASTSSPSFSLTSLSGGIGTSPQSGDFVVACIAFQDITDRNISVTTSDYTEQADLYTNSGSGQIQLGVFTKKLTSADTSVEFSLGVTVTSMFCVHVWRYTNETPLDASTTTSTSGATAPPDAPSITTATSNAVVIAIGSKGEQTNGGSGVITEPTAPSGMENLFSIFNIDVGIAIASAFVPTPSTYDPSPFGGFGGTLTTGSSASATLALRP